MAYLPRLARHNVFQEWAVRRSFGAQGFARIERAIAAGEIMHRAEVRFAIEGTLPPAAIWRGLGPRERAIGVFSEFRIWDTEENVGLLIYLLAADHAVEFVADRGLARLVDNSLWQRACEVIVEAVKAGRAVDGVVAAIELINPELARLVPARGEGNPDELPNRPIRL
jgi:hypothetical protein